MANITYKLDIAYNDTNSIFDKSGSVQLTGLSYEFVQGLCLANTMYDSNERLTISNITAETLDYHDILLQCIVSDRKYEVLISNGNIRDPSVFSNLCNNYGLLITKRYLAVIDSKDDRLTIVQFDSMNFLNGVITYKSWNMLEINLIHAVFDMIDCKNHRLQIEHQLPIVNRRLIAKKLLGDLLISDISDIIWDYVVYKCGTVDNIIECATDIDIVDESISGIKEYKIYEDLSDTTGNLIDLRVDNISNIQCSYCRYSIENPYVSKVTLI